jgi:autotransporter-associated beta strand protein
VVGTVALTKTGSGTLTLTGTNTYTGTTRVNAGKLFINGNQTSSTGALTVTNGATLGGTGTIGGNTTIAAGGKLEFNINTAAASHDKLELAATKTLTFSGASTLTITSTNGAAPGTYVLLTAPGGITGPAPATVNLPAGWAATNYISGSNLMLNVTSIYQNLVTTNGHVPYVWLATWTNNFESAVTNDWDRDGFTTVQEYWSGTDPMNSNSFFRIESVNFTGTNVVIKWQHSQVDPAIPPICIQAKSNLVSGGWVYVGQLQPTNGTNMWSTTNMVNSYYRLCVTNNIP